MIAIQRPVCPDPVSLANHSTYKSAANKTALMAASNGKCMYCESYIAHSQFGDVEHIRPKVPYPHLKFEWGNLGICCAVCNNNKRDDFDEQNPSVDPYTDDPENHLKAVGAHVVPLTGSLRGRVTVDIIELNRMPLIERRSDRISKLERVIRAIQDEKNALLKNRATEIVLEESGPASEYALVARTFVNAMMAA